MSTIETVAIIDDDDIYQFAAEKMIKSTKLVKKIHIFSDGQEAIDFFSIHLARPENLPDIIFLDLNMPVIDGWQFLEQFAFMKPKIAKNITIYIVTSSMNPDDLIDARRLADVSDYIVKPITTERFLETLK
tara:strand:- start:1597 stop:1989 length:393 start_codon:yes stop_codon:yes gene_type:complete